MKQHAQAFVGMFVEEIERSRGLNGRESMRNHLINGDFTRCKEIDRTVGCTSPCLVGSIHKSANEPTPLDQRGFDRR